MLLNEIAWSYRAIGAKVWMLDSGAHFEETLPRLRWADDRVPRQRPHQRQSFSAVTDIHDDMAMLQPVVAKMASPLQALEPFAYKAIASAILIAWEAHGPAMTVTHIRDCPSDWAAARSSTASIGACKDLAVMLEPFSRDGAYGRLLRWSGDRRFFQRFVVIEEEELKRSRTCTRGEPDPALPITRAMYLSRNAATIAKSFWMMTN